MLDRECPCKARMLMTGGDGVGANLMRRDRVRYDLMTEGEDVEESVLASVAGSGRGARVSGWLLPGDGLVQRRVSGARRGMVAGGAQVSGLVDDVGTLILWGFAAIGAYFVVKGKFRITAKTRA